MEQQLTAWGPKRRSKNRCPKGSRRRPHPQVWQYPAGAVVYYRCQSCGHVWVQWRPQKEVVP